MLAFTQPAGSVPKPGGELGPDNIGGVTPNKPGLVFEPGVARLLRGNSDIVMQIHYTANGNEGKDRTTIGVIFAKQPPTKMRGRRHGDQPALRDPGRTTATPKCAPPR